MATLKELPLADVEVEIASTRRILERLPDDRLTWKPHEKSRTIGDLGAHLADIVGSQVVVITEDEMDAAARPFARADPGNKAEILKAFDENVAQLKTALENVDESALTRDWTFRFGDHVIFTSPKLVAFRSFGISHIAHHRGQLTVYLRLLDLPVPSIYGPSADEG
ncbi:MAG TPA: DinB family protein [Longimicrobiaceae bacterium]|nr:DinB family protein [Longimicrobiaceae bacterium]